MFKKNVPKHTKKNTKKDPKKIKKKKKKKDKLCIFAFKNQNLLQSLKKCARPFGCTVAAFRNSGQLGGRQGVARLEIWGSKTVDNVMGPQGWRYGSGGNEI